MATNRFKLFAGALLAVGERTPLGSTGNTGLTYTRVRELMYWASDVAIWIGSVGVFVAIVFYGFRMAISKGDAAAFSSARTGLFKSLIGAAIIFGVWSIIKTVQYAAGLLTG